MLQVSRETSPAESGVVTVGIMTTGATGAPNIIPNSVNIMVGGLAILSERKNSGQRSLHGSPILKVSNRHLVA